MVSVTDKQDSKTVSVRFLYGFCTVSVTDKQDGETVSVRFPCGSYAVSVIPLNDGATAFVPHLTTYGPDLTDTPEVPETPSS